MWNEGAERILGYAAHEILGQSFHTFYLPEEAAQGRPELDLRRAVEQGSLEVEGWRVRKDGSRFWAGVLITPILDAAGRTLGYGRVIRDLSERRNREDELRESEARLKRTVLELEGFAYTVSHDLRSPLRAIQGYSHFVADRLSQGADAESREMLLRIERAALRLDHLIRDLLSYSAISQTEIQLEVVDLDEILGHVAGHYPELSKVHLKVRTPLGRVRGQTSLLIQAVSNLLDNAVKFVPPGRVPEIEVWSERIEDGRRALIVQDNGIGIPRESWEAVFKPFTRLQPQEAFEGTGIGLAIVKRGVERMGGCVTLDSEPGCGSRFRIELPEA